MIVESPAKAKTIEKYLGEGYVVKSSFGHVRDLPKGNGAIDVENGFTPTYEISKDKKQVVSELKKLSKQAEITWLATDDDREGEAISWHLKEALGLKENKIKRIVFREITKTAITKAIQSPRGIDYDLVNAQQARRVLDRLVGFELSPVLWRKVKAGLSAGRVQSVAVRMVVDREREIEKFKADSAFRVTANFIVDGNTLLKAELPKRFQTEKEALEFVEKCVSASFKIADLVKKPGKRKPAPPFTTSTLQQEASRKLGYSVSRTMILAQKLYEAGHITYMRTDSLNLSEDAINSAENEITNTYGPEYSQPRRFKTKSEGAQEAHEAIRPTNFAIQKIGSDANEKRLYELIWKRAIASQMSEAQLERTTVTINISTTPESFQAKGEVVKFDGFLKVYLESKDDENEDKAKEGVLPPLHVGQELPLKEMTALERFSRPAPRYTEASLVKKMEEMGIGRPSTYAPTISTIQKRGYIIKEAREGKERKIKQISLSENKVTQSVQTEVFGAEKNKLFPTNTAMVVNDFLVEHFDEVINYSFTASVEEQFDAIAKGSIEWHKIIGEFYGEFHKQVEHTKENAERAATAAARVLGTDPKTGKEVSARLGRYGAYVQLGELVEGSEEKPQYASLRKNQFIESISLEDALELFKLPRDVGMFENKKVVAAIGRFGPYIRHDGKFVSLGKEHDPHNVDEETAIQLILAKREADAKKLIKTFAEDETLTILNGRWGAYIKHGKNNIKIPKEQKENAEELSFEDCMKIIEASPKKATKAKATKAEKTKTTAKKTTRKKSVKK